MPVVVCANGHRLTTSEQHAGRKIRCPKCQAIVAVPLTSTRNVDELEFVPPKVSIDGVAYELAVSHDEFCASMAARHPRALEMDLHDYPEERTTIARQFSSQYGESAEALKLLLRAPLCCRSCLEKLPENLGRRLVAEADGRGDPLAPAKPQCPTCKGSEAYFLFEPGAAALADTGVRSAAHDAVQQTRKPASTIAKTRKTQLRRAHFGIGLHRMGLALNVVAILVSIIAQIIATTTRQFGVVLIAMAIIVLLSLIAQILRLTGSIYCCYLPEKSSARMFIWITLALTALSLWCDLAAAEALVMSIGPRLVRSDGLVELFSFGSSACALGAWFAFVTYLHHFATEIKERGAANDAIQLRGFALLLVFGPLAAIFGIAVIVGVSRSPVLALVGLIAILALALVWVVASFKFLFSNIELYGAVRDAIQNRLNN